MCSRTPPGAHDVVPGGVERQAFAEELAVDAGMLAMSYRDRCAAVLP